MPVTISIISENNARSRQCISPGALFSLTVPQGVKISNVIGENLKKHNLFDFNCLNEAPDKSAFDQMLAFSFLYKSELGDLDEVAADNTTASLVCGKGSEEFFKYLNESGYSTIKCGNGIYRVNILLIDIYIIVVSELGDPEYGWMQTLVRQAGGKCREICINCPECSFSIADFTNIW